MTKRNILLHLEERNRLYNNANFDDQEINISWLSREIFNWISPKIEFNHQMQRKIKENDQGEYHEELDEAQISNSKK